MTTALEQAIARLVDGSPIDWDALREAAADQAERAQIDELRSLAQLDAAPQPESPADYPGGEPASGPAAGGRRWAHLELLEPIGHGAYGVVYRAWDTRLAREVAVKLVADTGAGDIDEARRLARVAHPNVVAIYGADRADGHLGLSMELLRGRTLDAIVRDQGPFSPREAVAIVSEICEALAAVHAAGLVHRDIKAQNIMREPGGRLVLMDLGTSSSVAGDDAEVASLAGTPLYMAPELFDGGRASVASDVYATGVLMYRLLTADFPIHAATVGDVRRAHRTSSLAPLRQCRPDLPQGVVAFVERCLAADPARRFPDVASMERALREIYATPVVPRSGARRLLPWLGGAAVSAGVLLATFLVVDRWRMTAPPSSARETRALDPDEYRVFSGYQELAFGRHLSDPTAAATDVGAAVALVRPALTGNAPIYGLLQSQMASLWRRAGDRDRARASALDASANVLLSVGEDHPYAALVAMEQARNAQRNGDCRVAGEQALRALRIRWRVLGLADVSETPLPPLRVDALERGCRGASLEDDQNGDGVIDAIELAAGLDAAATDGGARLALGLMASPFLSWGHYGAHQPRHAGWQAAERFPFVEHPRSSPPALVVEASQGQGFFTQRLSREQSARAVGRGFSLLARVQPERDAGLVSLVVDTSPAGPRFDVAVRRTDDRTLQYSLLSSVVPREGTVVAVDADASSAGPLVELRYRPEWSAAALFVDGTRIAGGYVGHRHFQDPLAGGVAWGVGRVGGDAVRSAAAFQLVWLEVF